MSSIFREGLIPGTRQTARRFAGDQDGAVTVDFVALTGAAVVLALIAVLPIAPKLLERSGAVSAQITQVAALDLSRSGEVAFVAAPDSEIPPPRQAAAWKSLPTTAAECARRKCR